MIDDYKNVIDPGLHCIEGRFMEKVDFLWFWYKLSKKKKTFLFRESAVYPFVQFNRHKKGFFLSMEEYVEVLNYVDSNGLSRI